MHLRVVMLLPFVSLLAAGAIISDLAGDFSTTSNPTATHWFYSDGPNLMTGPVNPAIGWGAAGTGWAGNYPALLFKASGSELDWQPGDMVAHTPNNLGKLAIVWESTYSGIVEVSGSIWGTRDIGRSTDYALWIGNAKVSSGGFVSGTTNRAAPLTFGAGPAPIAAGNLIQLILGMTTDSRFGDFVGITLTVRSAETTTVPEPSTAALAFAGAALLCSLRMLRRHSGR